MDGLKWDPPQGNEVPVSRNQGLGASSVGKTSQLLEQRNDLPVGLGEGELVELFGQSPIMVNVLSETEIAFGNGAPECVKLHPFRFARVLDAMDQLADPHPPAELLDDLPVKSLLKCLSTFHLSSGELPEATVFLVERALGYEDPSLGNDEGRGHPDAALIEFWGG